MLEDRTRLDAMRARLEDVRAQFDGIDPGAVAADTILGLLDRWTNEAGGHAAMPTAPSRPLRIEPGPEVVEDTVS
jgi:hypothetical protein